MIGWQYKQSTLHMLSSNPVAVSILIRASPEVCVCGGGGGGRVAWSPTVRSQAPWGPPPPMKWHIVQESMESCQSEPLIAPCRSLISKSGYTLTSWHQADQILATLCVWSKNLKRELGLSLTTVLGNSGGCHFNSTNGGWGLCTLGLFQHKQCNYYCWVFTTQ